MNYRKDNKKGRKSGVNQHQRFALFTDNWQKELAEKINLCLPEPLLVFESKVVHTIHTTSLSTGAGKGNEKSPGGAIRLVGGNRGI